MGEGKTQEKTSRWRLFKLVLAVLIGRKILGFQGESERVTWGLLYIGPRIGISLADAAVDIYQNYEQYQHMYEFKNLSMSKDVGWRVAKDLMNYFIQRQAEDVAFIHLQRRLFEIAALRGYMHMLNDGYEYADYIARGVPCRVVARGDLMPDVRFALGLERGELTLARHKRLLNFRWILQHHGGGYISGTIFSGLDPGYRMGLHAQNTSEREPFDLVVVIVDYALAPEMIFPGAVVDGVNSYEWHCAQPLINCSKIAVTGESAGGGLVGAMILALQNKSRLGPHTRYLANLEKAQMPRAAVMMSAFIDVRHDVAGCSFREGKDVITVEGLRGAARIYCPNETVCAKNPLASPVLSDFKGTPPLLITAGADEILYPSLLDFAQRAKKANPDGIVHFEEYHEMYHSFQLDWNDNCVACKEIYSKTLDFVVENTQ